MQKTKKQWIDFLNNIFIVSAAKQMAKEWAVDYKPWEDNLPPQAYASYGYEKGYEAGIRLLFDANITTRLYDRLNSETRFVEDCLKALLSKNSKCAPAFAELLNENPLENYDVETIWNKWNDPKSPVRNFLLVRQIDYPEIKVNEF